MPEWGAVPGLLPSEGLALSRSYVVEAPSIKENPLLNKLILQGCVMLTLIQIDLANAM